MKNKDIEIQRINTMRRGGFEVIPSFSCYFIIRGNWCISYDISKFCTGTKKEFVEDVIKEFKEKYNISVELSKMENKEVTIFDKKKDIRKNLIKKGLLNE